MVHDKLLFTHRISDEPVVSIELGLDALHCVGVRLDEAAALRWHVFHSSKLIVVSRHEILSIWRVHL